MVKTFFEKTPAIGYDINGSGEKRVVCNILQRIKIRDLLKDSWLIYYEYDIRDGDTPEILADKVYGNSQYHWIILLANDIIDPYYDWPLSYEKFHSTIEKKYGSPTVSGERYSKQTVHHYEDLYGNTIDETHYLSLPDVERSRVTVYDWEVATNEAKRRIRLMDAAYIDQIDIEADKIMKRPLV